MTYGEIERKLESEHRKVLNEAKEKASYDYILANLIGTSVGRLYSNSNKMPTIEEVYPSIFDDKEIEEERQAKQDELTVLRFKQFAEAHNKKIKGGSN